MVTVRGGENGGSSASGASAIVASGTSDTGLTWKLGENGLLTISGTGEMRDFTDYDLEHGGIDWLDYRDRITQVRIGDGVTTIGSVAFYDCSNLSSVIIPDSVTTIGEFAFADCVSLSSVTIPNGVKEIKRSAFAYCTSLTEVTLADRVLQPGIIAVIIRIDTEAFFGCELLESVYIPAGVSIPKDAFPETTTVIRR